MQIQNTGVLRSAQNDEMLGRVRASANDGLLGRVRASANDGTPLPTQRTAKLIDGAHQFEAMMLQQMLKPLKFGESPDTAGNDESSGGANDTLQGYGTEALAKAIASQGGFGIARQIIRQVTAQDAANIHSQGKE